MDKCSCTNPGYCSRHRMIKDKNMFAVCQSNVDVFLAYEVRAENIVEPGIIEKAMNYSGALAGHIMAGSPVASDSVRQERLQICKNCPLFKDDGCIKCGCPVAEKTKWADQQCPLDPPKWGKTDSIVTAKKGCKSCGK